ncbi:DotG/IcmE/VirB10 family protein [Roseomonas mucosa]|uniref:DotG/IcmE/VirB10 family protein n=1 Tax=Roseomonas mucosa TaxID=207340 RepID=UPI003245430C
MSDTAIRRRGLRSPFNRALGAGPMRLAGIAALGATMVGIAIWATFGSTEPPAESRAARQAPVNTLPGGPNSNPYQDRLAVADNQRQAGRAQEAGRSFTPPINASQRGIPPELQLPPPIQLPAAIATPAPAAPVVSPPAVRQAVVEAPPPALVYASPPARGAPSPNPIRTVAQTNTPTAPADDPAFRAAVNGLFGGWQGRPGQTTVTLAPSSAAAEGAEDGRGSTGAFARPASAGRAARPATTKTDGALPGGSVRQGRVLMPAGRGLYAHTVLAVSSETGGPIVLQADSGPIAGARLIGSFNRAGQSNRLVVRVTRVQYQGQTMPADGIVVAPDSMETAVATSVDQRMLERFVLPAAAAFIAGLGQAVATTSNTYGQIGALGGTSFITRLNPEQQLAVGAGGAAQQVGRALEQAAPRGPTIHLAANAPVGIMFLQDLRAAD